MTEPPSIRSSDQKRRTPKRGACLAIRAAVSCFHSRTRRPRPPVSRGGASRSPRTWHTFLARFFPTGRPLAQADAGKWAIIESAGRLPRPGSAAAYLKFKDGQSRDPTTSLSNVASGRKKETKGIKTVDAPLPPARPASNCQRGTRWAAAASGCPVGSPRRGTQSAGGETSAPSRPPPPSSRKQRTSKATCWWGRRRVRRRGSPLCAARVTARRR